MPPLSDLLARRSLQGIQGLSLSGVCPCQSEVTNSRPTLSPSGAIPKQNPPKCYEPLLDSGTAPFKEGLLCWNWAALLAATIANIARASDIVPKL